jgi:NAD(P)-dependent dehydrogenase (short-subunit alcohol dehydrogenase family)
VTGGAQGIGAGISDALATARAHVVVVDIDVDAAAARVAAIAQAGGEASAVVIDMAQEDQIVRGCAEIVAKHGAPWALVNNAGVQERKPFFDYSAADWDRFAIINARGPYLMTRELAPAMIAAGKGGRIVNVASANLTGLMLKSHTAYAASKGAVIGLSRATALELVQHNITVNVLQPGGTITPGGLSASRASPPLEGPATRPAPMGYCEPRDMGAAVLFFVSPEARYITNQVLTIDAGWALS